MKAVAGFVSTLAGVALLFSSAIAGGGSFDLEGAERGAAVVFTAAGGGTALVAGWRMMRQPHVTRRERDG